MKTRYVDMWRPMCEQWAALGHTVAGASLIAMNLPFKAYIAPVFFALAVYRTWQVSRIVRFRQSLASRWLHMIPAGDLLAKQRALGDAFWLGTGFEWVQKHAQLAYDIKDMNPDEVPIAPWWWPGTWLPQKTLAPKGFIADKSPVGLNWIHGIEPDTIDCTFPISAMEGHTLIVGTTGAGKTRLLEILTFQAIHSGSAVFIIDPKGDKDWLIRVQKECKRAGRVLRVLDPAYPETSVRINPLKNWNAPNEVASRVSQVLPSENGNDPYTAFIWRALDIINSGELMTGRRATLRSLYAHIQRGVGPLLFECADKVFAQVYGSDWVSRLSPHMKGNGKAKGKEAQTEAIPEFYRHNLVAGSIKPNDTVQGLISIYEHDSEHFSKMIPALLPLLQMLTVGELGDLLSPDDNDIKDKRPITDTSQIIRNKEVCYIALNSLANKTVGSALGSMFLADVAAVAGQIYNFEKKNDIHFFMDESAEALNDQAIQILNKGRGAGFKMTLATQTIADFEARLGKKPKSIQTLGNTNNLIVLRLRDTETMEWAAQIMGETSIYSVNSKVTSARSSDAGLMQFNTSEQLETTRERLPLIPMDLFKSIPNLQFFAMIAGGKIIKARIPIIT